jgi:hypothetical protein
MPRCPQLEESRTYSSHTEAQTGRRDWFGLAAVTRWVVTGEVDCNEQR